MDAYAPPDPKNAEEATVAALLAAGPEAGAACGTQGRSVTFQVADRQLATDVLWSNDQVHHLDLGDGEQPDAYMYYLPMIPATRAVEKADTPQHQYLPHIEQ